LQQKAKATPADMSSNGLASARVPVVHVGEVKLPKSYDFFIHPNAKAQWGGNVTGTLGVNILQDLELEIDMARRKVGFYSQKHCRGKVVYWAAEWFEIPLKRRKASSSAAVLLDGKELTATLDTGSTNSILDIEAAKTLFGLSPGGARLAAEADPVAVNGKKTASYKTRFKTLTMGGFAVHGPSIRVADLSDGQIVLGMQHLQYLHLYFAYGEGKVYATAANATFPDPGRQATRDPKPIYK
jgi:hypothetical protein